MTAATIAPVPAPPGEPQRSPLRARLERLMVTAPSWRTERELAELERSLPVMDADERLLYAAARKRQSAAVEAKALATAVVATTPAPGCPLPDVEAGVLEDELAGLQRRSTRSLQAELSFARWVTGSGPVIFTLLSAAAVSMAHLRVFDDETGHLDAELARRVDAEVSPRAASLVPGAYRKLLRQAIVAADPDNAGKRHSRAKRRAGARLIPEPDGMSTLALLMATTDAVRAVDAINALADAAKTPEDSRTHGMRQIDALLEALRHALDHTADDLEQAADVEPGDEPDERAGDAAAGTPVRRRWWRRGPEFRVTIDFASLMGWRNLPAELDGHGPIPAEVARALACEPGATFRRLVYDEITGVLIDLGSRRYAADAHLRRLLEARDVTCRYPGCQRAAWWCDTEHCVPHDEGGPTSGANCGLVCRKHHNRKTHDGFSYTRPDPTTGAAVWTTPNGFTYRQAPATYLPTGTHPGDTSRVSRVTSEPPPAERRGNDPPAPRDNDPPPF